MTTASLLDQYCPEAHQAPLTAADFDATSSAAATADEWGVVAITRQGEKYPGLILNVGSAVYGALAVSPGGSLVGIGDESGRVAVYNTWDGACVFEEQKDAKEGRSRAMRACAFNPENNLLATLAVDGIIRIYDIGRWERIVNWQGFGGESLDFNDRGDKLLAIDTLGQAKLLDLVTHEQIDLEMVPGGVRVARFTPDCEHIVCMGQGGIAIIGLPEGRIVQSFTARGSSGMQNIVVSPDGEHLAAVTARSIHKFSLPDLQPISSDAHGAEEPTQAAIWDMKGPAVGGKDGVLHRPGLKPGLGPVTCVGGFGDYRVAAHGTYVAVWEKHRQRRPFNAKKTLVELRIDRDGRLVLGLPNDASGVQIYDARTGKHYFDAGPETRETPKMEVGGQFVAMLLARGGLRWYDLKDNTQYELPWVQNFALSGSGTWLGVTTPKGAVKVLDPATGTDAIPAPEAMSDAPITLLSFINRRPDMLTLDEQGVLSIYDLSVSVTNQEPAKGRDVLDFHVPVDRLWGITGGQYAAIRYQEPEAGTATILYVDLHKNAVVSEVPGLLPYVWVDAETGSILQPARGAAVHEIDMHGQEKRVLRGLPEGEWIAFGPKGILDASDGARGSASGGGGGGGGAHTSAGKRGRPSDDD